MVPRDHFTSLASMPARLKRDAEHVVLRFALRERAAGRDLIWFEHGSAGPASSGGCGIAHAHLHVLPMPRGWSRPALPSGFTFARAGRVEWLDTPAPASDYLLIGQLERVWVAPVEHLRSQALRRWLAPSLGSVEWDWRTSPPDPFLRAEVAALRGSLAEGRIADPVPAS